MCNPEDLVSQPPTKKALQEFDVTFKLCSQVMRPSSFKRHMFLCHSKLAAPESVCVDRTRGIYMVPKSINHGGIRYPIHVQKIMRKNEMKVFGASGLH